MTKKKFKCYIRFAHKQQLSEDLFTIATEAYGPHLGYYYYCQFIKHPRFGTPGKLSGAHTSLVVKETELKNGDLKIETLNSIYKIKKSDR